MTAPEVRPAAAADTPALRDIWRRVFGDPEGLIDDFLGLTVGSGSIVVSGPAGSPSSMMCSLPGADLIVPGERDIPCTYIYSLATLPENRGRGLGAAVARAAAKTAAVGLACLLPADAGLYDWYADVLGTRTLTYCRQAELAADSLPAASQPARPLDADAYLSLRSELLDSSPHVRLPAVALRCQQAICRHYGGGLFRVPGGCAICEYGDGLLAVKELLAPDGVTAALAALSQLFRPRRLLVRTPVFFDGPGEIRPFAVAVSPAGDPVPGRPDIWWGPAFD